MFEIFSSDSVADQCSESIIEENQTVLTSLLLNSHYKWQGGGGEEQMPSLTAYPAAAREGGRGGGGPAGPSAHPPTAPQGLRVEG